jgi:beta-galactosidase
MTEYHYPASARETALVTELERFRGSGPREVMTRALVTGGYAPDAVRLDDDAALARFGTQRVLALAPTPYLDDDVQARLVGWVRAGGRLLLSGPLPQHDLVGRPATTLIDALGLRVGRRDESGLHQMAYAATPGRTPFVTPAVVDGAPAWQGAEVAVGFAQPLAATGTGVTVLARLARSGEPCVVEAPLGAGRVVAAAADLPCLPQLWDALLGRLGARPLVETTSTVRGVVVVPCAAPDGTQVVHVLNVSPWDAEVRLRRDGAELLDEPLPLARRTGAWLVRDPGDRFARVEFAGGER